MKQPSDINPFQEIACKPQEHFLLHLYAAIYLLVSHIDRLSQVGGDPIEQVFKQYPFLEAYLHEIFRLLPEPSNRQIDAGWWEWVITDWEKEADDHLPLLALSRAERLGFGQRLALMLVGLVEEDSRFGTIFSWLQAPLAYRRPCWELIDLVLSSHAFNGRATREPLCQRLIEMGLVTVGNANVPRSEWELRLPTILWDILRGDPLPTEPGWCQPYPANRFPQLDELILPPDFQAQLQQIPWLLQHRQADLFILRGTPGSQRLSVLGAIGRTLGRGIIVMAGNEGQPDGDGSPQQDRPLGLLCTLSHMLPVISYDPAPGETVTPPPLRGYSGPMMALLGPDGGMSNRAAEKSITLNLPRPGFDERRRLWRAAVNSFPLADLDKISRRFHLPGDYIRQAAGIAITQARLTGHEAVQLTDVQAACRTLNRQMLDTLAMPVDARGNWNYLVVSQMTMTKLVELEQRCSHRETLLAHLGPAFTANSNRGVRALLTGPSGTGKTLAARILAAELEMDLYRVDLAAVINKYIGETEKNLNQVLSRAEELDVILLLDEGDSLLGGRTEVKSANDRYANMETNYLLQKLENYQGIVLITTNLGKNIDRAFLRRMDVVVNFTPPEANERWAIWQLHLPENHAVSPVYLDMVATRCEMTGGQIRNAAFHATMLALDDGLEVVHDHHLEAAMQSEYRKAGAIFPLAGNEPAQSGHGGVTAFLNSLMSQR